MATGIVKSFDLSQGFGFIAPDDGTDDIRVELAAAEKAGLFTLLEGERISFQMSSHGRTGVLNLSKLKVEPG